MTLLRGAEFRVTTYGADSGNVTHGVSIYPTATQELGSTSSFSSYDGILIEPHPESPADITGDRIGLHIKDLDEGAKNYGIKIEEFSDTTNDWGMWTDARIGFGDDIGAWFGDGQDVGIWYGSTDADLQIGSSTNYMSIEPDGEVNLHGTARVYKNEWIPVGAIKVPTTKPAAAVDYGISLAYAFDDSDDEVAYATMRLPQEMDRTVAPDIKIGWGAAATTGEVVWQVEYLYRAPNEALDAAADATLTTTTTVSGTSDGLTISTLALAAPATSDQLLLLRIKRLGTDGDDDLSGDAYLVGCGLKYTCDKLGIAY